MRIIFLKSKLSDIWIDSCLHQTSIIKNWFIEKKFFFSLINFNLNFLKLFYKPAFIKILKYSDKKFLAEFPFN